MSAFLLEVITWVPFMLGNLNLVCYLPRSKHSTLSRFAPVSCPGVGYGSKCIQDQLVKLENSYKN